MRPTRRRATLKRSINRQGKILLLAIKRGRQAFDYPLEYDSDGYPELPACLDRRVTIITNASLMGPTLVLLGPCGGVWNRAGPNQRARLAGQSYVRPLLEALNFDIERPNTFVV